VLHKKYTSGDRLGQFEIQSPLGEGGMGVVYRARDTRLGRHVALKVLPGDYALDPDRVSRFRREAAILASLSHPNVGAVYDFEEINGVYVLVLELIEGETLASRIERAPLPPEDALPLFAQIARALAAAHECGIIHRDLKPSNIKIGPTGKATVLDFGIAKPVAPDFDGNAAGAADATTAPMETTAGILLGTPAYMSPEHLRGQELDGRSDLWALGCCLYQALTGKLPFPGNTATDVVAAVLREAPDWEMLPPDLPPEAMSVLRRCLEKDVSKRLRDARDVSLLLDLPEEDPGHEEARNWQAEPNLPVPGRPNWILAEKLGEGGFGEVWLAAHSKTMAKRVFKFCRDPERIRGLKREVILFRLMKDTLGDRNDIAQIIDWQFDRPPFYLESEYTQAGDLSQWARARGGIATVPMAMRVSIVAQVTGAVAAAHSVGILHKDIKPSNILISDTPGNDTAQAILTDFGIGFLTDRVRLDERGITATGLTEGASVGRSNTSGAGTRMYMAPELIEGKTATVQSDVYALGVLLYQVAAGDFSRALAAGWERDIADPLLREDIAVCVDGNISHRLQSASELHERLTGLEMRRVNQAQELAYREELERAQKAADHARLRRRRLAAVAVLAIIASIIVTMLALRESKRAGLESELRRQADLGKETARAERDRAENNLKLARSAVHEFFTAIDKSALGYDPSYDPLRRELIESSLRYLEQFVNEYGNEQSLRGDLAWSYFNMAAMLMQLDDSGWIAAYKSGLRLLGELVQNAKTAADLGRMAEGVWHAGSTGGPRVLNAIQRDPQSTAEVNAKAIEYTEALVARFPEVRGIRNDLGIDYHLMGHILEYSDKEKSMAMHLRALELWQGLYALDPEFPDYMYGIALSLNRIGDLHGQAGRGAEALNLLEQTMEMYQRLLDRAPAVPQFQETHARSLMNYGSALVNVGRVEEGIQRFDAASDQLQALMTAYPGLTHLNYSIGDAAYRRATALWGLERCDEAATALRAAASHSSLAFERFKSERSLASESLCPELSSEAFIHELSSYLPAAVENQ